MWWYQGDKYICHNDIIRPPCLIFSQHSKLTNQSMSYDMYIWAVGAQFVIPWEHGPLVITLGLKGLK